MWPFVVFEIRLSLSQMSQNLQFLIKERLNNRLTLIKDGC